MNKVLVSLYEAKTSVFIGSWDAVTMRFVKERYTPFTTVSMSFVSDVTLPDACEVRVSIDSKVIHEGAADKIESRKTPDGLYHVSVYSRGYTAALSVNQPIPNINSNANLTSILTSNNIILPNVACEPSTKTVNYVFILDKDTLWDAIVAYGIKAYKNYPYIRNSNTVYVQPPSVYKSFTYSDSVLELLSGVNMSNLISQINMKDFDGSYESYELENTYSIDRRVIRQTKINLDEQWLSEPDTALRKRVYYANRAAKYKGVKVDGYSGEDLFDKMTVKVSGETEIKERYIHKIEIIAGKKGVFTKIYTYYDSYSGDIA